MAPTQVRSDAAVALPRDAFAAGAKRRHKVLPEHARAHNRTLVLQTLLDEGPSSRADLARATALTRVTVSDLVGDPGTTLPPLIADLGDPGEWYEVGETRYDPWEGTGGGIAGGLLIGSLTLGALLVLGLLVRLVLRRRLLPGRWRWGG